MLNSLIKYAKGQGEKGVNNLQKIKDYLGEENNAFLEMQILNKLFKESVVENDRAGVRVFDSESFLSRVRELVGENELYAKNELDGLSSGKLKEILQSWDLSKENNANKKLRQIVSNLENDEAKELSKHFNFKGKKPLVREIDSHQILHALNRHGDEETELKRGQKALTLEDISEYENIVKNYDFKHIQDNGRIIYAKQVNGHHIVLEEVLSGQDKLRFFDMWKQKGQLNKEVLLSHSQRPNANLDQMTKRRMPSSDESITQPLFKSKEAREFLELVEGFHKLYKNDASIAKNLVQGTASQLSTSIATSAEGAIKQKVVKCGFDPIFRLLPDGILFGLFSKQIQGGALRYHLKKALSRSLNYDDFKIKLEKELKRTNFNSNTSRLIDEFMQNLEDFNREKEQFLEAKRAEEARIKEEEQARINAIKTAQENAYNAQEANLGNDILEPSSLKEDFGENFAGYKGKEAIEKLLEEQRGQVKGAFYKEGLGEIDLVWGEITDLEKHKGYGLAHILDKRKSEFIEQGASESEAAQKAAEFAKNEISNIMQNGKIINKANEATRIETQDYRLILKQNWKGEPTKNKWLVTAYMKKEKGESISSTPFTKEDNLSLNSKESIAQNVKNDEVLEPEFKDDFGVNFEGFKGKEAVLKLLSERKGQVKGAFYKEGLGDIDLVWGEVKGSGKGAKGYGLSKIIEKHSDDFKEFGEGLEGVSKGLDEIITKGEIHTQEYGRKTIIYHHKNGDVYKVGLKQNWKGEPTKNSWVITGYKEDREADKFIHSSDFTKGEALPLNSNESIAQKGLSADEAISILQSIEAKQVPKELDIEGFLKELNSVENKENFISHLSKKEDAKSRLAYLNLVKPTLEEADLILKTKNKFDEPTKEFIKAFQDENKRFFYIVITEQDNERKLLTAFKTNKLRELKNRIEKARDFGEISSAHRFFKSPTAENILKQKSLNLTEKLYLKDNDTPLNVEYKIVNKDDIKPSFELSKTQYRSEKQEELIEKIKNEFNPDLLVNIRGDLKKGNPIITKQGEVISGNHRAAALKELKGENLAKYQNAVKEAFGVELKENEMLVRVADTSEAEIRRFSAASNEGLENNLGEQGVSLFAKYQDKIKALKMAKRPFVADDVYNLKYLVNKALGETSITKENDTSKALFASLARGRNNTILKALNELEKENLEQVSKVANMFFDNAGAFYNLTHDLDMPKMQNLQNYFSDVLVSAARADYTRAEDFTRLNEDIRAFLDSGDKNAMLKLSPNLVSDLLAKAMGAGFARFARLENPSASLYEFLNGLKKDLLEKGAPDLFSGGKGIKLNERDEFDFAKELILKGQDSEEKFRLYQNLEELKAWKSKSSLNQPTKESLDKDLNKSYTLELENLEPVSLNANALSKETEALTQSVESGHKQSTTIAKTDEQSIAQNAKKAEFESFKDKIKELYTKYEGLNHYDKNASYLKSKLLNQEIKPEIKKEFKSIIDKFKGADNKDKMLRVIKENKEELSDYLAFNIALRKDIYIDGYGVGKYDFYDKLIRNFFKLRENKQWSEIDESKYRALAALENLSNKNTSLYFSFKGLNGKVGEIKTYPRIQDLLFYDLILGYDLKNAVILSTKDKLLKEKLIEKLKAYIDKKIYADFLEYKIKDLESRNPKNSHFENYKDEKWDEEALKSFKKELEDLRANEKAQKLEAKGSEDIIFTDTKGKEHTLTKETQKAWLEAFGLKSLEEAYIPNFKAEVKEAINRVLGGEEIKLTKGSLIKLIKEKRLKYLDRIKPTLENPHSVILQNDGALIFARDYGEEKYFTSVARNDNGEWIIRSNAPKSKNGLNNKILNGGKEIYNDQAASQINASNPYDDIANSNIKLDNESIAQNGIKDNKQAFLQFIKIMQDTKNGDFYPSENLQNALEKSGKKARENALELFIKEYESKDAKLVELLKNIQEPRIASKALSLIKHFTQARMMQSAIKAVPSDILMKYVNIDASQRLEVLSSLYGDFSNIMKEVTLKGKKIPDPAALSEKGGAYVFNRQYRKILNIYEKIQENEELLRLLAHKNDYKTTIEIIQESKAKGLSVKQTKEAIEENKKQTAKLFDEVIRQENKPSVKPLDEFGINFEGFKGKEAIEKLLEEQRGQVKGAFYKEGLGEIDLVWGDENFGLRHIIDKHGDEFEDIAAELDEIIAKGVLEKGEHRYFIKHNDYKGMIALDYKGKESNAWILTLYKDKSALNPAYQHQIKHNTNTSSETRANGEFENSNIKNANLQKEKVDKLFPRRCRSYFRSRQI